MTIPARSLSQPDKFSRAVGRTAQYMSLEYTSRISGSKDKEIQPRVIVNSLTCCCFTLRVGRTSLRRGDVFMVSNLSAGKSSSRERATPELTVYVRGNVSSPTAPSFAEAGKAAQKATGAQTA